MPRHISLSAPAKTPSCEPRLTHDPLGVHGASIAYTHDLQPSPIWRRRDVPRNRTRKKHSRDIADAANTEVVRAEDVQDHRSGGVVQSLAIHREYRSES